MAYGPARVIVEDSLRQFGYGQYAHFSEKKSPCLAVGLCFSVDLDLSQMTPSRCFQEFQVGLTHHSSRKGSSSAPEKILCSAKDDVNRKFKAKKVHVWKSYAWDIFQTTL